MSELNDLRRQTRVAHPPVIAPIDARPLSTPIYQNHLFAYDDADTMGAALAGPRGDFFYSRWSNPTVRAFEEMLADLEGGAGAVATGSGMGAVNAVLMALLETGDHVIAQSCLYGGTYSLLQDLARRWGISLTFVSGDDPEEVRGALRPQTRVLLLETIANPTTQVVDIAALARAVRDAGVRTVVDNTFATPLLCRPIEHGADVVVHSATKYLGGHSDILGGVVVLADDDLHDQVWRHAVNLGSTADPFAAWLAVRGLATLALRVARQSENALALARRLAEHPSVTRVGYPGLPEHPQYELARRVLDGCGGLLSFDLSGGREAGRRFIESVKLVSLAVSLGDVKTLVMHPASTSHARLDSAALRAAGIAQGTVRIAVGIEDPDDLWADIEQALAKAS